MQENFTFELNSAQLPHVCPFFLTVSETRQDFLYSLMVCSHQATLNAISLRIKSHRTLSIAFKTKEKRISPEHGSLELGSTFAFASYGLNFILKVNSHRAKMKAKAKNINEQSEQIKKEISKIKEKFAFEFTFAWCE